jgi:hypothetical protein
VQANPGLQDASRCTANTESVWNVIEEVMERRAWSYTLSLPS